MRRQIELAIEKNKDVAFSRIRGIIREFKRLLTWLCRETPIAAEGQDATEKNPGSPQLPTKFEINVSKNGKHVFATDSHIRNYRVEHIAELIGLFRAAFPDCKVEVSARSFGAAPLPASLKEKLEKT